MSAAGGGLGIRSLATTCEAAYVGAWLQCAPYVSRATGVDFADASKTVSVLLSNQDDKGVWKLVKIDRHYPAKDGEEAPEPERLEYTFDEVEAVEYEGRVQGEDYCSAIILRLNDGQRLVYEDSKELNFKSKAQEMAQAMSKPVDVVHEDEVPSE